MSEEHTALPLRHVLWKKLTEPHRSIGAREARYESRVLASLLIMIACLMVFALVVGALIDDMYQTLAIGLLGIGVCYGLSRTAHYRLGAAAAIIVLFSIPNLVAFRGAFQPAISSIFLLEWPILGIIIAYFMFSWRLVALTLLVTVVGTTILPLRFDVQVDRYLFTTLNILFIFSVILSVFSLIRSDNQKERAIAEQALRESEARYRAILETQTELVCRWLPDMTLTFVNEAYCRYFGKSRDELIGQHFDPLIHEDDRTVYDNVSGMITPEHPTVTLEHRVTNGKGEVRWMQWIDHALFDARGRIVEYQSVGRDIHEQKTAEAAEREQRRLAEALTNTAALLSSTLDLDEVLDRLLAQVASVLPATLVDIMLIEDGVAHVVRSRGYAEHGLAEYAKNIRFNVNKVANLRRMVETGKPSRIPDTHVDPDWLYEEQIAWIRSNVGAPIELEGETIGFLNISSETPDAFTATQARQLQAFADQAAIAIRNARLYEAARHHADVLEVLVKERTAQLEVANQSLKVMFDATGEGIIFTEDERIVYANPAMTSLTGYDQAELVGVEAALLRDGRSNNGYSAPLLAPLLRDQLWRGDMPLRRKDGSRFHAGLTVSRVDTPDATGTRTVTLIRDISREKALQEQKSNFVAYASHELRTPITNLKTRLYLLRKRPEYLEAHLAVLDHVTEWMQKLVEDLLDITRLERSQIALKFRDTPVQELIKRVVVLQTPEAERKSITLSAVMPDEPIVVCLDGERIIQVITNLTINAINYTHEGGSVTISALPEPDGAVIQVRDTGIGIEAKHLPHIFEPFYRVISEVEGTGLGLPIARQIVEMHGGRLEVQSEPGVGTCFSIHLLKLPRMPFTD